MCPPIHPTPTQPALHTPPPHPPNPSPPTHPPSRRKLWSLVPWDPSALYLLYRSHQAVYRSLRGQAPRRRLFAPADPAPPSQLREGRTLLQVWVCGWGWVWGERCGGACTKMTLSESRCRPPTPHTCLPALQDMLCAAAHSRAAYGYAMAAGHVSSVLSYIRLHTLQPLR